MGRVLRLRKQDGSSTSCSESSQSSNSSNSKLLPKIDNSRKTKSTNGRKKINNKVNAAKVTDKVSVSENRNAADKTSDESSGSSKNERSVLVDKTNSILNGNVRSREVQRNRVHFSSQGNIRTYTERKVANLFHEVNEGESKSPKPTQPEEKCKIVEKNKRDTEKNLENEKGSGEAMGDNKGHVPIYKLPVVNGRKSFHLTPPQVEDKNALYEFEVDENEPVTKKRRRPIRPLKKKRLHRIVDDMTELHSIPLRTMALRNDGQSDKVNYKELNDSDLLLSQDHRKPLVSGSSRKQLHAPAVYRHTVLQPKQDTKCLQSNVNAMGSKNKENITKQVITVKAQVHQQNGVINQKNIQPQNPSVKKLENNLSNCKRNYVFKHPPLRACNRANKLSSSNETVVGNNEIDSDKSINCSFGENVLEKSSFCKASKNNCELNRSHTSTQSNDASMCTSLATSPFPEYSRIGEGVQVVGPLYNLNCSEVEYNNDFVRGVTASTPVRVPNLNRTPRHDTFQVRLSGGEVSNRYGCGAIVESDNDDDDCYGFGNEITEVSLRRAVGTKPLPSSALNTTTTSEPLQKISVSEVIALLKQDVNTDKKRNAVKKNVLFENVSDNNTKESRGHVEKLPVNASSSNFLSPDQSTINDFLNITSDKGTIIKTGAPQEDLDATFVNPPRRSYSITPRRVKRVNYCGETSEEEHEQPKEEKVCPKKIQRKYKITKKEAKEMEKQAEMMNSQFSEIDKFSLVVENIF